MAGYAANIWQDIELRIDPDSFCKSCHISSMNKKARSKTPLKPKAPFKWFFMEILPATSPILLTSETSLFNYLLIVDAYSKTPIFYGTKIIITD